MIEAQDQVALLVNGARFTGWTNVRVGAGIERIARDFSLTMTRQRSDQGLPGFVTTVKLGDKVEVFIGGDLVVTGYIDALPVSYDAQRVDFSAAGRSCTADLVDCSAVHPGGQWLNRTLAQIARDLARPYGVTVIDRGASGAALQEHQIDPGETAFESISRALRLRQVLAFDDPQGQMILDRVGGERAQTALVLGENIKSGENGRDFKECFSEYRVNGQRAGNDDDFAAVTSQQQGRVQDGRIRRNRLLVIKQPGQATLASCKARAQFERDRRAAKPFETSYTVVGWRQGDGSLWRPNLRVLVWDEYMGYAGAEMVIAEVEYAYGDEGTISTLRVGPAAAYLPEPPEEGGSRRKASTGAELDE